MNASVTMSSEVRTIDLINTKMKNIDGSISNLKLIMDSRSFKKENSIYLELKNKVPKDNELSDYEKKYGGFGFDLKYTELYKEICEYEEKLKNYNVYKLIYDSINDVRAESKNVFKDDFDIESYIDMCKKLVDLTESVKNNIISQQFSNLIDSAIDMIFKSLEILSLTDNNNFIDYIGNLNSDSLREKLGEKIRNSTNLSDNKGNLEDDYVDLYTIKKCALNDENISKLISYAEEYKEIQKQLGEDLDDYNNELLNLKKKSTQLKIKKALINFLIIPSLVIPLSIPFIGYALGKKKSDKIDLVKTITNIVDVDNNIVKPVGDTYEEVTTRYVASVTICDPYKKSMSGASYIRNCTVYDYQLTEEEQNDSDFHLNKYNIDLNRLVIKYSYEEPASSIEDEKYLSESQMYITETYQLQNERTKSKKYIVPYTCIGTGVGIMTGTIEYIMYKNFEDNISNSLNSCVKELDEINDDKSKYKKLIEDTKKKIKK